uniref:Related to oxidoreductase n=1 Tax=Ramularia collo-cygni TaxID=112498 RepID=A0A2D3UM03_9PEZI
MAGTTAMMRSLVSPQFGEPSIYELRDGEMPNVKKPTEILIKVEAASINAHDVIMASGRTKAIQVLPLPYPIGLDFAGTVLDSGSAVSSCGPGDSVYGFSAAGGTAATHLLLDTAKAHTHAIACIPAGLGMVEAAGLPAVAITAMLALQHADNFLPGGLQGKTVFIPGALSGVGSIALQIAKRKYNARTLTAASGGKIPKIGDCLGQEVVDTVFDYTQVNVTKKIGKGEVDFVFDTTGLASEYLPMIKRGGLCLSIARLPPGSALKDESPDAPHQSRLACIGQNVMDGMDNAFRTWAKTMYGVVYVYQKTEPNNSHMQELNNLIQSGVLQPVIGKTAGLNEIEKIRDGCTAILKGKGGIGKFVILMDDED